MKDKKFTQIKMSSRPKKSLNECLVCLVCSRYTMEAPQ
jgi:hypothetical protein